MSIPLLRALNKYYDSVELAAIDPTTVVPSELDFVPGPGDDLESMIWVLTYAIILRYQEGLRGPKRARYKLKVVEETCLTLDSPRSVGSWRMTVLPWSPTNPKNGFPI